MALMQFMKELAQARVKLTLDNGALSVSAPKGVATPALMAKIKEHKAALLEFLQQSERKNQAITVAERGQHPALSFAQQRLWLLDKINGGSTQYNMPAALALDGALNEAALNQALSRILERHESLRTRFAQDGDGQPFQLIATARPFKLALTDLSTLSPAMRELRKAVLVAEEASRPFDLSRDDMLRAHLLKLAPDQHVLLVTMHHIASDGWSMAILVNEFSALYKASVEGKPDPLPALPLQYADYAHWQRTWLQGAVLDQQLQYWREQLADLPMVHSLPLDYPRPRLQSYAGHLCQSQIDAATTNLLLQTCQRAGATLFMGLHAVFSAFLAYYSNETDIVLGTPVANREQPGIGGMIGFFANTLVLRNQIGPDAGFTSLLQQSKTLLLDAYAHQQVPFEQIVDTLHPERSLNHNPLFQIMLVLQNNQQGVLDMPGLSLTQVEHEGVIAKFDLTLSASETADGLLLSWEYNTDLFEASRITRMGQHFAILLRAMLNAPDTPVFALEMLTPDERQQLRAPLQQSLPEFGGTDCIHQRFEHFAASTPEAIAVVFEDQAISYGELNARANRLAHYLRAQQSIRPDTLVGLCLERSVAMMVGLLAIVKAGAAYVPLDPDYPAARLAHMLADARLDCVMTLQHLRERAIGSAATAVLCLDDPGLQQALAQCPDSNIDPATSGISRASLAYVIFTSGSTGQPKGVMIGHGNITRLFDAARSRFDFNQRDVWSMFHSFAFDFSVWEIWGALAHGGKLVMVPYPVARSPADFYQLLLREQVTVLNQTPGSFVNLIEQDQQGGADSPEQAALALRYVIFGGEALNLATLAPWMEKHGDQQPQLINMYGITETTVHVTFRRIEQHMLATANGASYIGDPLPDLTLHIVNRALTLVPPGIVGEMLVGGAGLARGYLNQPELTAARFIHLPGLGQQRLYRSGDLAQRLPNGELNYIGRIDHQVKIRGYRIELGEIEHALASYSGIREVVVVARNDAGGEKILVAYLSLSEPAALPADSASANASLSAALRVHLAGLLPQFMVPSFFVVLPALPLNQNGKVDLKALPQPDASSMLGQYEAPQLEVERILAQVWSGLLNLAVEKIGRQANFFECGGNSFLAIQLSTRFAHAGYQLSVTDAMQHQTLAAMAAAAAPIASTASSSALQLGAVPILPNHAHSLRVSSEGRNRWNNNSLQELPADYDADCLGQALQLLITHHDALRLCHVQDDEGVWQAKIIAPPESTSFRVIQLGVLSDEQYRQQINDIMEQLMDSTHVGTGPVIQMCVLDFAGSRQPQLMTSINHYATDATSNFILAVNFKHIYEQLMAGQTVSLPGNSTSYFDYAHYLHRYMGTAECAAKLDYWLGGKRFTDTAIPLDFPDGRCAAGSFKVHNGVHRIAGIDSAFQSGAPSRASLQEVLMAAFMRTYALWSGKDFVHLNLIDSGRFVPGNELDISRTVGWMSGLYPLVMELNAAVDDVNAILSSVAQQLRSVPMDKSCGLLRFCHPDPLIRDKMAQIREPRINFNFLGHTWSNQQVDDGGIKQLPLPEAAQSTVDAQGNPYPDREHFLLFDIKVHDDYLLSNWDFSTRMHHAETIAWLDQTFAQNVTQMLALLK